MSVCLSANTTFHILDDFHRIWIYIFTKSLNFSFQKVNPSWKLILFLIEVVFESYLMTFYLDSVNLKSLCTPLPWKKWRRGELERAVGEPPGREIISGKEIILSYSLINRRIVDHIFWFLWIIMCMPPDYKGHLSASIHFINMRW